MGRESSNASCCGWRVDLELCCDILSVGDHASRISLTSGLGATQRFEIIMQFDQLL